MSDGVRLASGYIELTVKKAGNAMKEITADITGISQTADKVGQQAADSLSEAITRGVKDAATDAGKSLQDELTSASEKAGKSAGDALNKGITKGAKQSAEDILDEITKNVKKAGDDVAKTKIEPKIIPKVDTKSARAEIIKDIGGAIIEGARQSAAQAGYDMNEVLGEAAGRAAGAIGKALGEAIGDSPVGGVLRDIRDWAGDATEGLTHVGDAVAGIKNHDPEAVLGGISGALKTIGGSDAGAAIDQFAGAIEQNKGTFTEFQSLLASIAPGLAGRLGPYGAAAAAGWAANDKLQQQITPHVPPGLQGLYRDIIEPSTKYGPMLGPIIGGGTSLWDSLTGHPHVTITRKPPSAPVQSPADIGSMMLPPAGASPAPPGGGIFTVPSGTRPLQLPGFARGGIVGYDDGGEVGKTSELPQGFSDLLGPGDGDAGAGLTSGLVKLGANMGDDAAIFGAKALFGGLGASVGPALDVVGRALGPAAVVAAPVMDAISPAASTSAADITPLNRGPMAPGSPVAEGGAGSLVTPPPPKPPIPVVRAPIVLPGLAGGSSSAGVDSMGRVYGPGSGTSDSILGIGPDGMPTAFVSNGEGVVRKSAMNNGGSALVGALNSGWSPSTSDLHAMFPSLRGHDDGTPQDPMTQRYLAAIQNGLNPNAPLPQGSTSGGEGGLQNNSIRVRRILSQLFPEIGSIGGYRAPDGYNEHSSGQALDVMIPGWNTPGGKALGDQISNFLMQNAGALGLDYTIWQHGQHNPDGSFQQYEDRGSPTDNHMDHVHVHSTPSGYPGRDQQYTIPPQLAAILGAGGAGGSSSGMGGLASLLGGMGGMGRASDLQSVLPALLGDDDPATAGPAGAPGGRATRTQGYIPAGAGGSGQTGTSFASGLLQLGASAVNGVIDLGADAAETAIDVGISAAGAAAAGAAGSTPFDPGGGAVAAVGPIAGAAAGGLSSFFINMATQAAHRGVDYGFQMAGIGIDSLMEILMPFGVPRFLQTDPMQFMPQLPDLAAALTTGEKAQLQADEPGSPAAQQPDAQPGGPVQPGQLDGRDALGAPIQLAQPQGVPSAPIPVGAPAESMEIPGVTDVAGGVSAVGPQEPLPPAAQQQRTGLPQPLTDFLNDQIGPTTPIGPPGVFDDGGWLPAGGVAINKSKRPEPMPVFTADQWGTLNSLANREPARPDPSTSGSSNDYSVRIDNVTVKDVEDLQNQLDSRQRLQMMRYAGRP